MLWWRSDRRRIYRRLDGLESLLAKSGAEDQLTAFGKVRQVVDAFAPGFLVVARPFEGTIADRQELAAVLHGYRGNVEQLAIRSLERDLTIESERGTASLHYVTEVSSASEVGPSRQRFEFRLGWMKERGEWLLHDVELLSIDGGEGGR